MSHPDIMCVCKDEAYRLSLSDAEQGLPPEKPAKLIQLRDQLAICSGALAIPVVVQRCARADELNSTRKEVRNHESED